MVNAAAKYLPNLARGRPVLPRLIVSRGKSAARLALVPASRVPAIGAPTRPTGHTRQDPGQAGSGRCLGRGLGRGSTQMASVATDDIDILAKARRSLDSEYTPSDDEEYMTDSSWTISGCCCSNGRSRSCRAAEGTLQTPAGRTDPRARPQRPRFERDRLGHRAAAPATASAS